MSQEGLGILERAANIAKASLTKIEAPAKEKAAAESKVAAENKAKEDQAKKDEGVKLATEQEAKSKEDERILTIDDKELSEPELVRKADLKETKRKKDESPDEKIKRVQESSQKRIDEIKSEMLAKDNKTAQEMAALRAELDDIKKPKQQEDIKVKVKREQAEQIAKYVEEDKTKPKEDRREMTKDDLDSWYLEDPVEATKWIQRTEYRRIRDLEKAEEIASKPVDNTAEKQKLAKEFVDKQNESKAKLIAKFPNLIPSKEKINEIRTKLGFSLDNNLTQDELNSFNKEYSSQNEEFKLCMEIVKEKPEYLESTNGPELVMAEMEKRLKKPIGKIEITEEDLQAKIEEEIRRRKLIDGEGITSTNGGKRKMEEKNKSELRQKQEQIARKAGISIEDLDKSIARRGSIKGASSGGADE